VRARARIFLPVRRDLRRGRRHGRDSASRLAATRGRVTATGRADSFSPTPPAEFRRIRPALTVFIRFPYLNARYNTRAAILFPNNAKLRSTQIYVRTLAGSSAGTSRKYYAPATPLSFSPVFRFSPFRYIRFTSPVDSRLARINIRLFRGTRSAFNGFLNRCFISISRNRLPSPR